MTPDPITRRQALVLGAVGAGALAVGGTGLIVRAAVQSSSPDIDDPPASPADAPATTRPALTEPAVLTSSDGILDLDLVAQAADVSLGGETVRMLTYNGTVPGPTLHLRPGDVLRVRVENRLDEPTNLHTHGLLVSPEGHGDNPFVRIGPGERFDYEIALSEDHPSGVFWYHPHHHGMVADQLFAGLYGAIVVDEEDWQVSPPRVVVVSDVTVAAGAVVGVSAAQRMLGRTGETLLANGQPVPALRGAPGSVQRMLLVNACASRYLHLDLRGLRAQARGVDSVRWDRTRSVETVLMVPGGRADLEFTMPDAASAIEASEYDRGRMRGAMMGGGSTVSPRSVLLALDPVADLSPPQIAAVSPTMLTDLRAVEPDAARTLTLSMGMGMGAGMRFAIDGRSFSPERIDTEVRLGTVEEWTIVNDSPMDHPFHLHVWPMHVVQDGDLDVRDVVDVPAGGTVTVRIAFDRFAGRTVYHCHILDHEDLGMMGVIGAG